jgi:putative ABC transport system permease protein
VPLLARLALRNLLRQRWRTFATTLGIGLGIASVLATLSVGENVNANLRATLKAAVGPADLLVTPGATGRAVFPFEDTINAVLNDADVRWAVPVFNTRAEPARAAQTTGVGSLLPGIDTGFQLGGRLTDRPETLPARVVEGRLPQADAREVAIGANFASGRAMQLGDAVEFTAPSGVVAFTLVGLLDDAYALASTNGGRVGITHLSDLQAVNGLPGRASHIEVALTPQADLRSVGARLEAALGGGFTVTYPAGVGDAASGIVQTLQAGLLILASTLMALGGFIAYNTFMASVVERTREYALLRTVCMRRRDVRALAMWEAAWVSAAGIVLGLLLGVLLALLITTVNAGVVGYEVRTLTLPLSSVLTAIVVGVLVALLAASLPARAAARTSPLMALRENREAELERPQPWGWVLVAAGVLMTQLPWRGEWALLGAGLAMATFFVGMALVSASVIRPVVRAATPVLRRLFGVAGNLGGDFAVRNAPRNGVAMGTVIVGAGLIVGVAAMVEGINTSVAEWLDTTIVGDLFVTSAARFPADFELRAGEVDGIDQVSGVGLRAVRFQPTSGGARTVAVILVDPERFNPSLGFGRFQFIAGLGDDASAFAALSRGGEVLAANTIRDRFGVGVGDVASLRTDEGFMEFPISAVVVDFTGGGEAFVASIEDMPLFGGGTPDLFVMTVLPGETPALVRERLVATFPELLLDVTLNDTYRQQIETLINNSFATTNSLLILAALIAALGVTNTLGMNLSRRAHEVAVLRTLGMRRAGVRNLVLAEGMVVVITGAILGLAYGLLLANVITAGAEALTGYALSPAIPWRVLLWSGVFVPLLGLLASYLPARRAAALPPRVALGASEMG